MPAGKEKPTNGYDLALFLHVTFIVALFSALAIVLVAMGGARRAETTQAAREWARTASVVAWLMPAFAVLAYIPAGYMVGERWSWERGWIKAAATTLVLMFAAFVAMAIRLRSVARAARQAPDGPTPADLHGKALDPVSWLLAQATSTVGIGVIALMTFKPRGGASVWIMVGFTALGLLSAVPAFMRRQRLEG